MFLQTLKRLKSDDLQYFMLVILNALNWDSFVLQFRVWYTIICIRHRRFVEYFDISFHFNQYFVKIYTKEKHNSLFIQTYIEKIQHIQFYTEFQRGRISRSF